MQCLVSTLLQEEIHGVTNQSTADCTDKHTLVCVGAAVSDKTSPPVCSSVICSKKLKINPPHLLKPLKHPTGSRPQGDYNKPQSPDLQVMVQFLSRLIQTPNGLLIGLNIT